MTERIAIDLMSWRFSGTIQRVSQKTMWISGNQTGGLLGDGSTGVHTYVTPADPDFEAFDRALGQRDQVQVAALTLNP